MAKASKRSKGLSNKSTSRTGDSAYYHGLGEADHDSPRAKRIKPSKSNREVAQMGEVSDSQEDLGHSMSV